MIREISFNNITICAEDFGSPENPALLLIMGAASSMIWWDKAFCNLMADKGFYVIRYDNRDTGKSTCYEPHKPGYCFEDLAEDAIQVLDAYNIERAIIMGMSMGGFLAQMIGVRHPERVNGIVLLSTMYFAEGAENLPYSSNEVNEFFETFGSKEFNTIDEEIGYAVKQFMVTSKSNRPKNEKAIRRLCKLDVERANSYGSRINHSVAQVTGNELTRINEITAKTLVIHGTEDEVIPLAHGEMLAKTIKNAVLQKMEGAGHEFHPLDYQDVANGICNRFSV